MAHGVLEKELHFTFPLPRGRFTSPFTPLHRDDLGPKVVGSKRVMRTLALLVSTVFYKVFCTFRATPIDLRARAFAVHARGLHAQARGANAQVRNAGRAHARQAWRTCTDLRPSTFDH